MTKGRPKNWCLNSMWYTGTVCRIIINLTGRLSCGDVLCFRPILRKISSPCLFSPVQRTLVSKCVTQVEQCDLHLLKLGKLCKGSLDLPKWVTNRVDRDFRFDRNMLATCQEEARASRARKQSKGGKRKGKGSDSANKKTKKVILVVLVLATTLFHWRASIYFTYMIFRYRTVFFVAAGTCGHR